MNNIENLQIELYEAQNEIIRLQSECIDELFRLLAMYIESEELSNIPAINKIKKAAMIRAEHEL